MRYIIAFFLLLIFVNLSGQDENTLLWRIKKDQSKDSYIFGTIHLDINKVATFDSSIYKSINRCEVFAAELDIGSDLDISLMSKLLMDSNKTIRDLLKDAEFTIVRSYIQDSLGLPFFMFERIKPFFITALVQQAKSGLAGMEPVDMHLYNFAKKVKKKCIGLETIDEQLSAIDQMSIDEQVDALLETIKNDSINKELSKIIDHYLSQDLLKLKALVDEEEMSIELKESLLDDRNYRIANRILDVSKTNTVFVAVGAAHLIGDKGILKHLKDKGFDVSPVTIEIQRLSANGKDYK